MVIDLIVNATLARVRFNKQEDPDLYAIRRREHSGYRRENGSMPLNSICPELIRALSNAGGIGAVDV